MHFHVTQDTGQLTKQIHMSQSLVVGAIPANRTAVPLLTCHLSQPCKEASHIHGNPFHIMFLMMHLSTSATESREPLLSL